jgi:LacI family transcriptional regulator
MVRWTEVACCNRVSAIVCTAPGGARIVCPGQVDVDCLEINAARSCDTHMARRRTTLKDVADAVGVHVSTVSRALNPGTRHFIRPEVAARIQEVSAELNYQPNAAAYSLRTNRTLIIGVMIPDIANPVFPPIIHGIETVLAEAGYMVVLMNTDARATAVAGGHHAAQIEALAARGVDGLIIASVTLADAAVEAAAADGLPVVTVNRRSNEASIPSVTNDEETGLRLILEHVAGLGHRRIAYLAGSQTTSTGKGRYDAYERQRNALSLDPAPDLVAFADELTETEGERLTAGIVDTLDGVTAIVASNDRLAVGAIGLLKQRGIACPAAISVTGFNDMPMVDRLEPPLTTVRVQQYEVGRRAAQLLLAHIEGRGAEEPSHVVMPVELVVRGSTARVRS